MLDQAFTLWEEVLASGVKPTVQSYELLMACCLSAGHTDRAIELINNLPAEISPSSNMFSSLVRHCAHQGEVAKAAIILESMKASNFEVPKHLEDWVASGGKIPIDLGPSMRRRTHNLPPRQQQQHSHHHHQQSRSSGFRPDLV